MKAPFEIEWLGGVAEKHFRRLRPDVAALPWGTLEPERYPPSLLGAARITWTQRAVSEYRAALAFTDVLRLLLEARAPLDLVGMAGDFVADEVSHVEIAARVAMELGGAVPLDIDTAAIVPARDEAKTPIQRANERVLTTTIHETFSEAVVTGTMKIARQPLLKQALELILRDEARHSRIGWLYLDWASEMNDSAERERLAAVALDVVERLSTLWRPLTKPVSRARATGSSTSRSSAGWTRRASRRAPAIASDERSPPRS